MEGELLGYGGALTASIFFGSFNLPLKFTLGPDPNPMVSITRSMLFISLQVYQIYMNVAIFLHSMLFIVAYGFPFTLFDIAMGITSAALWVFSSLMAIIAIQNAGLAIAQGVWSSSTIIVSFLWGVLAFGTVPKSLTLAIVALGIFVLGIVGFSISGSNLIKSKDSEENLSLVSDFEDGDDELYYDSETKGSSNKKLIFGVLAAAILGLTNGSMLAPGKFAPEGIQFIILFGIGIAVVTPVFAALYFTGYYIKEKNMPAFDIIRIGPSGIASGLLWNVGNCGSILATQVLAFTVGFPLSQTALLIGGFWGVVLFKEIRGAARIGLFIVSAMTVIAGAVVLALYGNS